MAGFFSFSSPVDIDIRFNGEENRKVVEVKVDKDRRDKFPLYFDGETVSELFYDRGNHYEFTALVQELAIPGEMRNPQFYDFEFKNVEKQYEITISRRLTDIVNEKDIWVYSYRMPPDIRIKIKHMELSIIRRETTGAAPNQYNESETITKFEIMDGAPVRGETIPIRLFLGGFELTPTFRDVNKKFSTRYYLNLVLVDEENRRYFKQQEITIYRRDDGLPPVEDA
ncbi:11928_t:CDS:2 [Diversispora eburnea]|uniref:11928_t:CDS:1 n=1 Tax=Diversispora eburnea TaxID=1213867 RepID=A0A9N8V724_9GLOM|nr:11928_t:CDS:2 [Diversispora eburnea]